MHDERGVALLCLFAERYRFARQGRPFTPLAGRYAGVLREDPCRAWGLVDGIEG